MYVGFIMHTELQHCSIYCQKLTNTEHIFSIRNWRDSLRCLIWVKFSIFTCVKAVCPKLYGNFFCLQFLKVLKLISPIEIIFSIPHSSLSIHVWRVIDEIFWLMWEILFDSFQLLVTNQMIFFPDKSECHCQSYEILLAFAVMSNCNDISQGALVTHMTLYISTVGCHNPYEYNISNLSMI